MAYNSFTMTGAVMNTVVNILKNDLGYFTGDKGVIGQVSVALRDLQRFVSGDSLVQDMFNFSDAIMVDLFMTWVVSRVVFTVLNPFTVLKGIIHVFFLFQEGWVIAK